MDHRNIEENITQEEVEQAIEEGKIETEEPKWISFLTGLRGDNIFDCKTNVEQLYVTDYSESLALLDFNVILSMFKEVKDVSVIENYQKVREIFLINYIKMLGDHLEEQGLTEEEYQQIKDMFNIDQIDAILQERKEEQTNEILNTGKDESSNE